MKPEFPSRPGPALGASSETQHLERRSDLAPGGVNLPRGPGVLFVSDRLDPFFPGAAGAGRT